MVMMECPARGTELSWGKARDDQQLVSEEKKRERGKKVVFIRRLNIICQQHLCHCMRSVRFFKEVNNFALGIYM